LPGATPGATWAVQEQGPTAQLALPGATPGATWAVQEQGPTAQLALLVSRSARRPLHYHL